MYLVHRKVQTEDLIYYHLVRDREQHSTHELFSYREDNNETAFVVAEAEKIYAHESLLSMIQLLVRKTVMTATTIREYAPWYDSLSLSRKDAKENVLGMEIIRDQSSNTLRVSQSRFLHGKLVQTLLEGHSILSLEGSLSRDCDVEKMISVVIFSCDICSYSFSSTTMGDENPIRTLGDYSKPSHEGYRNTIELPVGNNVVPLRSDTIRLVQNGCSFHRLRSEDPNQHLKDFLKTCYLTYLDGDNRERTRLRLFQFSLRDQASNWLERLPAGSITTWEDLTTRFLAQFFPSGRTAKLRNDILMFQQHHGESYPKHGPPQSAPVERLHDLNARSIRASIKDLALYNLESWNDPRISPKPWQEIELAQEVFLRILQMQNLSALKERSRDDGEVIFNETFIRQYEHGTRSIVSNQIEGGKGPTTKTKSIEYLATTLPYIDVTELTYPYVTHNEQENSTLGKMQMEELVISWEGLKECTSS
ncbi:MAK10-like protein [Tanacetum coccineum]